MGPDICAVVITRNEEVNIGRCLDSLRWCSDTVVLDSGSEDATTRIAAEFGARVHEHKQAGRFQATIQRNWALDNCGIKAEWVLFVDADEVVTKALAAEIVRRCSLDEGVDGYQLAPKYLFWGRWMKRCMSYPSWHDRLLRRGHIVFEGTVWEHFAPGTKLGRIDEPYLHYGNSKGFDDWMARHDRYSSWDAEGIMNYLDGGGWQAFGTPRKRIQRSLAARTWQVRPVSRFLLMYIVRGGVFDGFAAFIFCLRYAVYEYMTVEKVFEQRRIRAGLPL